MSLMGQAERPPRRGEISPPRPLKPFCFLTVIGHSSGRRLSRRGSGETELDGESKKGSRWPTVCAWPQPRSTRDCGGCELSRQRPVRRQQRRTALTPRLTTLLSSTSVMCCLIQMSSFTSTESTRTAGMRFTDAESRNAGAGEPTAAQLLIAFCCPLAASGFCMPVQVLAGWRSRFAVEQPRRRART